MKRRNLDILQGRLLGAIRFLKKTTIFNKQGQKIRLSLLPWYLFIGPEGAGKTSLLHFANTPFILAKQFKKDEIPSSITCDFWATRDLVIIDTPGTYLWEKKSYLWQALLALLKKTRGRKALHAIILALPLPELLKQKKPSKKPLAERMALKIQEIRNTFSSDLPIYFVITQCDRLPGFLEFFSEYGIEELAQPWGITLPPSEPSQSFISHIANRLNALIKRLNSQLIYRLHQEHTMQAKPALKDFPLQVERLKHALLYFLKSLRLNDLNIQGIYLTSATQPELTQTPSHIIQTGVQQALQAERRILLPNRSYFIKQFISHALLSRTEKKPPANNPWRQRIVYAFSLSSILAAILLLGQDFQKSILQTYSIQNNLTHYQLLLQQPAPSSNDPLFKALPLLDALQSAAKPRSHLSNVFPFFSFYSNKSQKTARAVYQKALQTIILPEIKNHFERYLASPTPDHPDQLYAVLKTYLMLSDPSHLDEKEIIKTVGELITPHPDNKTFANLLSHFQAAWSTSPKPLLLNASLITKTRAHLFSLPPEELGVILLKNHYSSYPPKEISLVDKTNHALIVKKEEPNFFSPLYTASLFSTILTQDIPRIAEEVLQGNNVLGPSHTRPPDAMVSSLTQKLRGHYIEHYVTQWEESISNLSLRSAKNLIEVDDIIANLISNTSPLIQFLQTLKENTSFVPVLNASQKIQSLDGLFSHAQSNQTNPLYPLFVCLRQLHNELQGILNTTDIGKSAFEAAKRRMENSASPDALSTLLQLANEYPEPLKTWLNTLAEASWRSLLNEAGNYVENAWQVNIMTIYRSQFAERFPLNPHATDEMDLQQLANFSGKEGTYFMFYQQYLKPFIDDRSKTWQWRTRDHQTLPFSPIALTPLQTSVTKLQNVSKYQLFAKGNQTAFLKEFKLPETLQ